MPIGEGGTKTIGGMLYTEVGDIAEWLIGDKAKLPELSDEGITIDSLRLDFPPLSDEGSELPEEPEEPEEFVDPEFDEPDEFEDDPVALEVFVRAVYAERTELLDEEPAKGVAGGEEKEFKETIDDSRDTDPEEE